MGKGDWPMEWNVAMFSGSKSSADVFLLDEEKRESEQGNFGGNASVSHIIATVDSVF